MAWLGIIIGMRFKRITVALIVMLCILAAWIVLPVVILIPLFEFFGVDPYSPVVTLFFLSPATVPLTTMFGDSVGNFPTIQAIISVVWHIGCWLALRKFAHHQLEQRLGRKTTKDKPLPQGLTKTIT